MTPDPANYDYPALAERLGPQAYEQRRMLENAWLNPGNQNSPRLRMRRLQHQIIKLTLGLTGMRSVALRNFHNVRVVTNELPLAGLPPVFDGYCVLQIADLHIDLEPSLLVPAVLKALGEADYDLCVNSGDFMFRQNKSSLTMQRIREITSAISAPHFGVLGNHDMLSNVDDLEAAGVRLLLNEAAPIERDGETLWLVGVDDPYFYQSNDLQRALANVPSGAPTLLLAHAPSFADEAAASGRIGTMLSGHTHGGQICLPGGYPLFTHRNCPRNRVKGAWREGKMTGYTSPGAGASGVAARFNCPPEITRHILRKGQ